MANNLHFDRDKFYARVSIIYAFWNEQKHEQFNDVDCFWAAVGTDDETVYSKSSSLQIWLFGYELSDTLVLFCKKGIYILSSKKKIDFIQSLENTKENINGLPLVHLLVRDKNDKDKANLERLLQAARDSGRGHTMGEFSKDKYQSEFLDAWKSSLKKANMSHTDLALAFAVLMAPKDENELQLVSKACEITCGIFHKYLREQIIETVDQDKKTKHSKLADGVDEAVGNKKFLGANVDPKDAELCYPAIIQSGGSYNLKFSVSSDKNNLSTKPGTILCLLGVRYKSYCSNLVRTIFVDPNKDMQDIYQLLCETEEKIFEALVPGAELSEVYEAAASYVRTKRPDLLDNFTKNVGFGMGIEFRESSMLISAKASVVITAGMMFNINLGFADVNNASSSDDSSKTVSYFLGDTVVVQESGPAKSLTEAAKKRVKSVSLFFKTDQELMETEEEKVEEPNLVDLASRSKRTNVLMLNQLREKQSGEDKRKMHQKELAEQLNREARQRIADAQEKGTELVVRKSNVSYKNISMLPQDSEVKQLKIFVDKKYETVILPVFGMAVPFHISMIKNISQSVEGDFTYLRINFFHPGAAFSKPEAQFPRPEATFLKELTYRSSNMKEPGELSAPSSNLNTALRLIKEVQKKFKTHELEEREKEGIVKQDKLVLSVNKQNPRLKDLYIRPNIVTKRISGSLEAHVNGFRYTSIRGDKVDILYNNIKHAFFQPCDKEMIILLHFHLKHAILFGSGSKKKHNDVQFFTEVGEITTDLGKHQHMHDRDDLVLEQQERELRHRLNLAFKSFIEKVEKLTNQEVEFDTPFRDLGFFGVPFRSSVLLQPTSGCLVHLTEWPPFVITLDELELVHFERVQLQLKNFDMVFVFKDYSKKVAMVNAIPMNMLDHVKEWLNSCDIRYTEGVQSLNWPKIMKTIVDDPDDFFKTGGWDFLSPDSDTEQKGNDDDDDSEEEPSYAPSDDEASDDEDSDDDYESEVSEHESDSEASLSSSEESGKSWSELEEEAGRADRERGDDDDDRRKKKASSAKTSSSKTLAKSAHRPPPASAKRKK